jgi:acyl carrier protein
MAGDHMAQTQTVEERIREFIFKMFPLVRKRGLQNSDKWLESGLLDSLAILDLVHFLEEEFRLQISDDELLPENFQSLDAVAAFVSRKEGPTKT